MMNRFVALLALVFLGLTPFVWGSPNPELRLSFEQALDSAKTRNVNSIVTDKRVLQALDRLNQARSPLLPQVEGDASQVRSTVNLKSLGIPVPVSPLVGPFDTFDARLRLTQTIFDLSVIQRLKAAAYGRDLSIIEKKKAQQDAMALVAALYIAAKRADQTKELGETLLRQDEMQLQLAQRRAENGTFSAVDLQQAEALLSSGQAFLRAAEADAVERHLDIAAALGIQPSAKIELSSNPELLAWGPFPGEALDRLALEAPDVEVAQKNIAVNDAQVAAARSDSLPRVSAVADYGYSGNTPDGSRTTYLFGGALSLPLFAGGSRHYRAKELQHLSEELQARLDDAHLQVETQARGANESLNKAKSQQEAAASQRDVADQQLRLAEHRLEAGIGSRLELLQARANRAGAEDQYRDAVALCQTAQVNLAHVLGRMQELTAARKGL